MVIIPSLRDMVRKLDETARRLENEISSNSTGRDRHESPQQPARSVEPPSVWEGINRNLSEIPFYRLNRTALPKEIRPYYVKVERGLMNYESRIDLGGDASLTAEQFSKIQSALMDDNPFLFYVDRHMQIVWGYTTEIVPYYRYSMPEALSRAARMLDIAESLGKSAGNDPVAIEMAVNDYLVKNVVYGNPSDFSNQYGDTALLEGHAVCKGISMAASFLLNVLGVMTGTVSGILLQDGSEAHAWNIVIIDGERYHLDVTNNHSSPNVLMYRYFNLSDDQMRSSHSWTVDTKCRDSSRAYYGTNGPSRRRIIKRRN